MDACILKFQICKPKVGVHAVWCDLHAADHCPHSCSHVGSGNHSVGSSNWSLTIFKSCSTTITHTGAILLMQMHEEIVKKQLEAGGDTDLKKHLHLAWSPSNK